MTGAFDLFETENTVVLDLRPRTSDTLVSLDLTWRCDILSKSDFFALIMQKKLLPNVLLIRDALSAHNSLQIFPRTGMTKYD
ncbi:hypothetical protein J2782_002770 [Brucella pseudogrignonensis]|uniref:Transposase n=1 Tax=Brucella pseudogrignonensis TaxID=419475 RepID=A0ABU1MAI2_9HYPH|nr:hypothetical protein [Brucella pseudogrignonensis]